MFFGLDGACRHIGKKFSWATNVKIPVCECDIGMGLEWSGNETHKEVRVVKVNELVHEVEDTQP